MDDKYFILNITRFKKKKILENRVKVFKQRIINLL